MKRGRPFITATVNTERQTCRACPDRRACLLETRCDRSKRSLRIKRFARGGIKRKTIRGEPISKIVHVQ